MFNRKFALVFMLLVVMMSFATFAVAEAISIENHMIPVEVIEYLEELYEMDLHMPVSGSYKELTEQITRNRMTCGVTYMGDQSIREFLNLVGIEVDAIHITINEVCVLKLADGKVSELPISKLVAPIGNKNQVMFMVKDEVLFDFISEYYASK